MMPARCSPVPNLQIDRRGCSCRFPPMAVIVVVQETSLHPQLNCRCDSSTSSSPNLIRDAHHGIGDQWCVLYTARMAFPIRQSESIIEPTGYRSVQRELYQVACHMLRRKFPSQPHPNDLRIDSCCTTPSAG